jgi:hypothetical protein
MKKKPTTAAEFVALLQSASQEYHLGHMSYETHCALNRALWSRIEKSPRTKSLVLAMLRGE